MNGRIVNIFKKGDPAERGNYRGITLLSVVGKLFTKLIGERIAKSAEEHGWLAEEQCAFRAKRRTDDHCLTLYRAVAKRRLSGTDTVLFFLDIRKAYDTVWRDGLLYILHETGIRGRVLGILKSMYAATTSTVLGTGCESARFRVSEGVRQGDPLSCVLFNLFINTLAVEMKHTNRIQGVTVSRGVLSLSETFRRHE